jgi:ADP-heptose:LPS heptosyltransferase
MRGNRFYKLLDLFAGTFLIVLLRCAGFKRRQTSNLSPRNIAVIKLAAIGDTLLLVPVLRTLRTAYPAAKIYFIGTKINEELIDLFPAYVDRFFRLDIHRSVRRPFSFIQFIRRVRTLDLDIILDFEQWSMITPVIAGLSGARAAAGFYGSHWVRHFLYSTAIRRKPNMHEAENFLRLLNAGLGLHGVPDLELPVQQEAVDSIIMDLQRYGWTPNRKLIVMHPGCGSHGFPREWPIDSYRAVCDRLSKEQKVFFVFTGNGVERNLTAKLEQAYPGTSCSFNDLSLVRLIAVLSLADIFISGNNGVMHLAGALKRPQIALHGPTNAVKWGPLNPAAIVIRTTCPGCPCLDLGYEFHRVDGFCMAQITVDEVYQAFKHLLLHS